MIPFPGPFDAAAAAHLLRRAAFAPSDGDVEAAVRDGLAATVDRLISAPLPPPTEIERAVRNVEDATPIAAAILDRAATSTAPLRENLALFFHNHFVSAFSKIRDARAMLDQLRTFRESCLATFTEVAMAAARTPAMVRYLDIDRSTKNDPNENFARELFELFTTGPGPYTESDIREAARAFTGHFVRAGRFAVVEAAHDDGVKTVLGQAGRFGGDDVVALAASHPATARFVAAKLARHFVADAPSERVVDDVARIFGRRHGNLAEVLRDLFTSELFFRPEHRRCVTRSPAALAAATARTLGRALPPLVVARHCAAMGQAIADPPSVKGWPSGAAWMNATTLLARRAFLVECGAAAQAAGGAPRGLSAAFEKSGDNGFASLLGRAPTPDEAVIAFGGAGRPVPSGDVSAVIARLLLHPGFQRS